MDSIKTNKCEATNRQGMLQILRELYSFEKSHSILQIVAEDGFWEDDYIQILGGFGHLDLIYYVMKCIPERELSV